MQPHDQTVKRNNRTISLALYVGRSPRLTYPKQAVGRVTLPVAPDAWTHILEAFKADSWRPSSGDALRNIARPAADGVDTRCGPVRLRASDGYVQLATRRPDGVLLQTALHTVVELESAVNLAEKLGAQNVHVGHDLATFTSPGSTPITLPDPWYHLCLAPLTPDFLVAEVLELSGQAEPSIPVTGVAP